jgi:hypothetical protein
MDKEEVYTLLNEALSIHSDATHAELVLVRNNSLEYDQGLEGFKTILHETLNACSKNASSINQTVHVANDLCLIKGDHDIKCERSTLLDYALHDRPGSKYILMVWKSNYVSIQQFPSNNDIVCSLHRTQVKLNVSHAIHMIFETQRFHGGAKERYKVCFIANKEHLTNLNRRASS